LSPYTYWASEAYCNQCTAHVYHLTDIHAKQKAMPWQERWEMESKDAQ